MEVNIDIFKDEDNVYKDNLKEEHLVNVDTQVKNVKIFLYPIVYCNDTVENVI